MKKGIKAFAIEILKFSMFAVVLNLIVVGLALVRGVPLIEAQAEAAFAISIAFLYGLFMGWFK